MYNSRVSITARAHLMLACTTCLGGGKDGPTNFTPPSCPLSWLLIHPLLRGTNSEVFFPNIFDPSARVHSLSDMTVYRNNLPDGAVLSRWRRNTTWLKRDTISGLRCRRYICGLVRHGCWWQNDFLSIGLQIEAMLCTM